MWYLTVVNNTGIVPAPFSCLPTPMTSSVMTSQHFFGYVFFNFIVDSLTDKATNPSKAECSHNKTQSRRYKTLEVHSRTSSRVNMLGPRTHQRGEKKITNKEVSDLNTTPSSLSQVRRRTGCQESRLNLGSGGQDLTG